jgi:hypothetical protein
MSLAWNRIIASGWVAKYSGDERRLGRWRRFPTDTSMPRATARVESTVRAYYKNADDLLESS